jgi:hypothetical protein
MEIAGVVRCGKIELPPAVHLPEGSVVRVLVEELEALRPLESEPVGEASVLADIAWATGRRFEL